MPSKIELGELGVALLGLWATLEAISILASLVPFLVADDGVLYGGMLQFLPLVVWTLVAGVLVAFRRAIAIRLFARGSKDKELTETTNVGQLEELLFAAVGLWWIASGASYALQTEIELWQEFSRVSAGGLGGDRLTYTTSASAWAFRAPYLLELAVGMLLFAGAGRLIRVWRILRSAGRDRASSAV